MGCLRFSEPCRHTGELQIGIEWKIQIVVCALSAYVSVRRRRAGGRGNSNRAMDRCLCLQGEGAGDCGIGKSCVTE